MCSYCKLLADTLHIFMFETPPPLHILSNVLLFQMHWPALFNRLLKRTQTNNNLTTCFFSIFAPCGSCVFLVVSLVSVGLSSCLCGRTIVVAWMKYPSTVPLDTTTTTITTTITTTRQLLTRYYRAKGRNIIP
mmetsp:Transcript_43128/g.104380  ORF Transcript_43128/g.104380 Transcript_43128/m.104380 type:complete len:133 (+) Transcript_43128:2126-2524(+)